MKSIEFYIVTKTYREDFSYEVCLLLYIKHLNE